MGWMSRNDPPLPNPPACTFGLDPLLLGTGCCTVAALGYTAANICVQTLQARNPLIWVLFVKESVAVLLVGPWLLWRAGRGEGVWPGKRTLLALTAVGLLTHLAGNVPLFWAMSVVGLAIAIPANLGVALIASAALGWFFLRERVSIQSAVAIAAMIASVIFLSHGAGEANGSSGAGAAVAWGAFLIALAVVLACVAGVVFGTLSLAIRHSATRGVSLGLLAMWIPAMGTAALGPMCLWRYGVSGLLATPLSDFLLMLLCGLLNLIAYLAIIKGLQMTTMVHANVVMASEAAMAAVAGLLFFQEASSPALVAGVCLTVAGMVLMDRPVPA